MDALTRKRAADAVLDARNMLRLQIQCSAASDTEQTVMLETLEGLYRSAAFGCSDDGHDPVFPHLQTQVKR